jgi:hypothetical protein
MLRAFFLCAMLGVLSGCKLAVIVVEGGEVQSSVEPTCVAGNVCLREIIDTTYSETFTAVPASGWKFVKWQSGQDFQCSNTADAICVVSNIFGTGIPLVEAAVVTDDTYYLMPVFEQLTPITDTVVVNTREWAQVDIFSGVSWAQLSAACPTGACPAGATVLDYDLSGWHWASLAEVGDLLAATTPHPGGLTSYSTIFGDITWANDFFDVVGFRSTFGWDSPWRLDVVSGFTLGPGSVAEPYAFLLTSGPIEPNAVASTEGDSGQISTPRIDRGAWFYRDLP